jgi:phage shock protein A
VRVVQSLTRTLSRLLASAEDPRESDRLVPRALPDYLGTLQNARSRVAAAQQRLAAVTPDLDRRIEALEVAAREAVAAARDGEARLALQRRYSLAGERRRLGEQDGALALEDERLRRAERRLQAAIETIQRRWEIASARYTAAEAQVLINEALAGAGDELAGLGRRLYEAEETAETMRARASATDEVAAIGHPDATEREIAGLERARVVAEQLEKLKVASQDLQG